MAAGRKLVILGIDVVPDILGFKCRLEPGKAAKCIRMIELALERGELHPGCAQKLAGRLSWACLFLFRRLGRAMMRPLFRRAHGGCSELDEELWIARKWWQAVLTMDIVEEHGWETPSSKPAILFVDARGVPPRCAAVLLIDGNIHYTDGLPAAKIMNCFQERCDNQITTLEILAISVGISTFSKELAGRRVVIYSDNKGAEVRISARSSVLRLLHLPAAGQRQ